MKKIFSWIGQYIRRTDLVLFGLCFVCSIFGIVLIGSVTGGYGSSQTIVQLFATVLGVVLFVLFSCIDADTLADHWVILLIFSVGLLLTLARWGVADDTGNRAWLRFGVIGVQPAEVVKITYAIILTKLLVRGEEKHGLNSPWTIAQATGVLLLLFGLIVVISSDLGSALIYLFMFAVVLFAGGVSLWWFLGGIALMAAAAPLLWKFVLREDQINRILAPYDSSIDPTGLGILWQTNQSKYAIANGGLLGRGLFHGTMTQSGILPQQHTDFIFAACGEELGFVGCAAIVLLLLALIIRCVYVGVKSNHTQGYLICMAIAAMFLSQTLINVGMCLGLTPVVGLTLPFFSYGGSSVITNYVAAGLVAGIYARPKPESFRQIYRH